MTSDGEELTFVCDLERQGRQFSIEYSATVDGDTMEGKRITPPGERPFTAKRQK